MDLELEGTPGSECGGRGYRRAIPHAVQLYEEYLEERATDEDYDELSQMAGRPGRRRRRGGR